MHSRAQFPLQALLLTAALCLGVAHTGHAAQMTLSGSITGTFSAPVLSGSVTNVDGTKSFLNNSNTAVFTGVGSNTFTWGNNPTFSRFVFAGNSFTNQPTNTVFELGTFEYHNGESASESLVFGETLTLQFNDSAPKVPPVIVTPYVRKQTIDTTANAGVTDLADSDSVSFDITVGTENLMVLLHVFEGETATAHIMGQFVSDPVVGVGTGEGAQGAVVLAPGSPGAVTLVPEPGSLILLGLGLGGIALTRRLRLVKR